MALRNRNAFTLVELLVVVAIIAILVGLTIPAVVMARSAARRAQCGNRQRELALAINEYEVAKDRLPGYVNSLGTATQPLANNLSWPVVLMPYTEHNDIWAEFRKGTFDVGNPTPPPNVFPRRLPALLCPVDDVNKAPYPLSYVANAGRFVAGSPPLPPLEFPLFVNRDRVALGGMTPAQVLSERLKDGAEFTIMLSENKQATQWLTTDAGGTMIRPTFVSDVGFLWRQSIKGTSSMPNAQGDADLPNPFPLTLLDAQAYYRLARPSSNHPGGVMVTFGDAHQQFLDEDVAWRPYLRMISPDDVKAGL